jgi:hypothetical protein
MVKYVIIYELSQNKNPNGKHCFLPFEVANVGTQSTNNKHN